LYTAAFVAEALRSGVNAVPVGQAEAARSIGLPFSQSMTQVVLPQAYRAVVPPLASVLIALAKNTSLAAAFGLADATFRMKGLLNDHPADRPAIFFGFALGYIIIVEAISLSAGMLERRWRVER
jgi:glutamate transport system permease protein